jgi:hypothetical protein
VERQKNAANFSRNNKAHVPLTYAHEKEEDAEHVENRQQRHR